MTHLQPPISSLQSLLRRWGLRLKLVEGLTWGSWGTVVGLALGIGVALAARLWPLFTARQLGELAALLALSGEAVGLVVAWARPRSLATLAHVFDRRFGLAERLTTAVEIGTGRLQATPALTRAQWADALDAVARIDLPALLPLRLPRRAALVGGMLVVALLLCLWLPNPQEDVLSRRAVVRGAVEEQAAELAALREEMTQAEGLTPARREMLLQALEAVIAALDEGQAAPEETLAALAEAEQALAVLQDPGAATVRVGLERAARAMSDSELTRPIAESLTQGDYHAAAQALATYSGTQVQPLTRAQELELARELSQAAQMLTEGGLDGLNAPESERVEALAEQLARAAGAIERDGVAGARAAVREAAQSMEEAGAQVQAQEAVEGALAQLQEGRERIGQASGARADPSQVPAGVVVGGQAAQEGGQPGAGPGGQQPGGGQQMRPGHHEDAGTGTPYDEVYVPYRLDDQGAGINLGREGNAGAPVGSGPLLPPQGSDARVSYRSVYADYADQASAALERSYIPLGLKRYVRDYFSSLEP